jgi:hypothetical protein
VLPVAVVDLGGVLAGLLDEQRHPHDPEVVAVADDAAAVPGAKLMPWSAASVAGSATSMDGKASRIHWVVPVALRYQVDRSASQARLGKLEASMWPWVSSSEASGSSSRANTTIGGRLAAPVAGPAWGAGALWAGQSRWRPP